MVEINWTIQSLYDIENIAEFISKDSERYAQIQVQRFFESVEILYENCRIGRVVPEFKSDTIRELILGNYRIICYLVSENLIDILAVHHSKSLLSNHKFIR